MESTNQLNQNNQHNQNQKGTIAALIIVATVIGVVLMNLLASSGQPGDGKTGTGSAQSSAGGTESGPVPTQQPF